MSLMARDAEQFTHLGMQKSAPGAVGLHPSSIDDKLRNGPLTDLAQHFVGGSRSVFNIDIGVGDCVLFKEALGFPAVPAP